MRPGHDYIGVGVGAMVFDAEGRVFLAQRGPAAKNERGCWEFPGGGVDFGERLEDAIQREFVEEYGVVIQIQRLLGVVDHLIPDEGQHWISPTYLAKHVAGEPQIIEPDKCSAIGWFLIEQLPEPLSIVTREDMRLYLDWRSSHS
jgi:8-oxo-dGTP diphosphatase